MTDREVVADNLISKCPSVSGASTGPRLTALTDKSCRGSVCVIEQELKYFQRRKWEKCCRGELDLIFTAVYIDSGLQGIRTLWTRVTYKLLKQLLLLSSQLSPSSLSFYF